MVSAIFYYFPISYLGLVCFLILDIIELNASTNNFILDEQGISWISDRDVKFAQVDGFKKAKATESDTCSNLLGVEPCEQYTDSNGQLWLYYYPNDETTQYLHESFPMVINPLEGVLNEHFIVWMRTAGLPTFRKLYGKIHSDLKKGDTLTFTVTNNFEVESFDGSKAIVLSTLGKFGGKNSFLGISYIVVGSIALLLGVLFAAKQLISPRVLGDTRYLGWTNN